MVRSPAVQPDEHGQLVLLPDQRRHEPLGLFARQELLFLGPHVRGLHADTNGAT